MKTLKNTIFTIQLLLLVFGASAQIDLGNGYGLGGLTIKSDSNGWYKFDDGEHDPLIDSVWSNGGQIFLRQRDTAAEVVSWLSGNDDKLNFMSGVSGGLHVSTLTLRKGSTNIISALVIFQNDSFSIQSYYGNFDNNLKVSYDSNQYLLKIEHSEAEHHIGLEEIPRSRDTSDCMDASFANSTVHFTETYIRATDCKGNFRHYRNGDRLRVTWLVDMELLWIGQNPNYIITKPNENIWLQYIYKK